MFSPERSASVHQADAVLLRGSGGLERISVSLRQGKDGRNPDGGGPAPKTLPCMQSNGAYRLQKLSFQQKDLP